MTSGVLREYEEGLLLEPNESSEDIAFFGAMVRRLGGPVLELGCGTGRLAIPMVRQGFEVVGLDISAGMLERFRRNLASEPHEIRNRASVVRADMRRFVLKKLFGCVVISSNTLLLAGSERAVGETLACIALHVRAGGSVIIDIAAIDEDVRRSLSRYPTGLISDLTFSDNSNGERVKRIHKMTVHGGENGGIQDGRSPIRLSIEYRYLNSREELQGRRREDVVLVRPNEMFELLAEHDFEVADTYGWYDCRPFSEAERKLLVVARKRGTD
ncbi:MAG: class I SAM-dependent methyltransferase [Candidatus Abyssobacteria bacterium SURF_17]|uniref:Class I SAM-dependent methyltransferase n=1 Tax=Candidatus Abyssobacteria bacterium SURF_17 TaxID=2093361 RepID=A0A419ES66_9BACT|nr:MAG: class I SAM-dependent methyltransferase [Candidatus Abyssubacteria bacterium SURF_17]